MKAAQTPNDELWEDSWVPSTGEQTIQLRSSSTSGPLLYTSWFCPFAQRAWIACEEKGFQYRWQEINPYEVDPSEPGGYSKRALSINQKRVMNAAFVQASPHGLVPAMDNDGQLVHDSLPLCEYINETFRGTEFLPGNSHDRAHQRIWASSFTDRIQKHFYVMLMDQTVEGKATARQRLVDGCKDFAQAMKNDASGVSTMQTSSYFMGEDFGLVDIAAAPFWQRFLAVGKHYDGFEFPSPESDPDFARLDRWWHAVSERQSVRATFVCEQRLVSSYSNYSKNKGTSDYALRMQASLASGNTTPVQKFQMVSRGAGSGNMWAVAAGTAALVGFMAYRHVKSS